MSRDLLDVKYTNTTMFCKNAEATTATFTKSNLHNDFCLRVESTANGQKTRKISPDAHSIIIHTIKQLHVGYIRGSFDII